MDEKKIHSIIDETMAALMAVFLFRSARGRTRRHSAT